MPPSDTIRSWYDGRVDDCQMQLAICRRQDDGFSRLRVVTFLPAIALAIYGWGYAAIGWPWLLAAAILVAAFMVVVRLHERVLREVDELHERLRMNEIQLARIDRRWDLVPTEDVALPAEFEAVANDLDLFGAASLFQLVSMTHTSFGRDQLRDWLLVPAPPAEIAERQQAVKFLAPHAELRESLDIRGRMLGDSRDAAAAFVQWAEAPLLLSTRPWLIALVRVSTLSLLVVVAAGAAGLVAANVAVLAVVAIACWNLTVNAWFGGRIHQNLSRVSSRTSDFRHYRPLLETIASLPSDLPFFAKTHASMGATTREPLELLAGLTRLVWFANLRRDGLLGVPYYLSQLFVLTDFHVVALMESWQQKHGSLVRRWLTGVGCVEAISSLATLAHDNPQWALPHIEELPEPFVTAHELGHPLLADLQCVPNDLNIGPPGSFVLVTGSNMSGKSTLLRAVGLNVTLAQAGGPVCARALHLPPVHLATCMRIRDSLADGVSFFLAELRRLKQIVDQSAGRSAGDHRTMLYLLDEVLQGTNSAERHIAVVRVVGRLVERGAIGIVSTHDLELAHSPPLSQSCQTVHFRENFTGVGHDQQMTFDYHLRSGLAPTTNALKLLQFVGLDE